MGQEQYHSNNDNIAWRFTSNGKPYSLNMYLEWFDVDSQVFKKETLYSNSIKLFSFTECLNNLYLTGKLIYNDRFGSFDKVMGKQMVSLYMILENPDEKENYLGDNDEKRIVVNHKFLLKSIKPTERDKTIITYEVELISNTWFYMIQTAKFSNYDKRPEDVFYIIQKLLGPFAHDGFNATLSGVRLNYITNGNENIEQAINYLLSCLYLYKDNRAQTMKFLQYNYITEKILSRDINDMMNCASVDESSRGWSDKIDMSQNMLERLDSNSKYANVGGVSNFPKTKDFIAKFDKKIFEYQQSDNKILPLMNMSNTNLIDFQNSDIRDRLDTEYPGKFRKLDPNTLNYTRSSSLWCTDVDVYHDTVDSYLGDNALVINVNGNIEKHIGDVETVNISNSGQQFSPDQIKYDDQNDDSDNERYIHMNGSWIIGKIVNLISPIDNSYRQNLVLFRNIDP